MARKKNTKFSRAKVARKKNPETGGVIVAVLLRLVVSGVSNEGSFAVGLPGHFRQVDTSRIP